MATQKLSVVAWRRTENIPRPGIARSRQNSRKSRSGTTAVQAPKLRWGTGVHGYHPSCDPPQAQPELMFGGRSFRLGRVFGIPIAVNWSWFLILFLLIYSLTGYYKDIISGDQDSGAFVLATVSALLFFASILLHELGHALVAIRNGIGILGIDLFLFGGVAKLERDSDSPGVEFRIAVAGPIVTLLIALICMLISFLIAGAGDFWAGVRFSSGDLSDAVLALLSYLAFVNLVLLAFNLIPAFPLDGGRIARAILWWRTGDRNRATGMAAQVGRLFSYVLITGGFLLIAFYNAFLTGAWFIFIGLFLGDVARNTVIQTAVFSKIQGLKVADVMDAEPVVIPGDLTVGQALDEYFLRYGWPWFPVVDRHGYFIGVAERERVERIPEDRQPVFTVREVMRPDEQSWRVRLDDPLEALLSSEPLRRIGALMAVDADGRLRGVVTIDQVRRALQQGVS
jgi:Zn-dependent protease